MFNGVYRLHRAMAHGLHEVSWTYYLRVYNSGSSYIHIRVILSLRGSGVHSSPDVTKPLLKSISVKSRRSELETVDTKLLSMTTYILVTEVQDK